MTRQLHAMRAVCTLILVLGAGGCDDPDFESRVVLSGYRVIGIEADPPEVGAADMFTLRVHDFDDASQTLHQYAWSLCLVDPGSAVDAQCASPALSVEFGGEGEGEGADELVVDLGPSGVDLRAKLDAAGPLFTPSGNRVTAEGGFDIMVRLDSGGSCADCRQVRTVKRVRVVSEGATPNQNPRILAFEIAGDARAGGVVELSAEVDTPEAYRDPLDDSSTTESYLYTWYSALGEADPGLTFDDKRQTELELPMDAQPGTEFEVIVALRDSRRGLAVERRTITVLQ